MGYFIGGSISGLSAGNLVIQNGSEILTVSANASSFQFVTPVAEGGDYNVQIISSPGGLTCTASNNTGINVVANVTNVNIACSPDSFTIGGTISGLVGTGLVLQNNSAEILNVGSSATSFTFATPVSDGGGYNVQVISSPTGYTCTANNNFGIYTVFNVNDVTIICETIKFTLSGTVTGLTDPGLVLENNYGDQTAVLANATTYTFTIPIAYGSNYVVSIKQFIPGLACSLANASGVNITADVTNINVICNPIQYTISGTVTVLPARGLVLQNNNSNPMGISPSSSPISFTFSQAIPHNGNYNVTVLQNPLGFTCTVTNGVGIVTSANVTNVAVECTVSLPYVDTFSEVTTALAWTVPVGFNGITNSACLTAGDGTSNIPTCASGGQGGYNGATPDVPGEGFLRLTTTSPLQQEGGIIFGSLFSMSEGLTIQFDAYSYGGGSNTADGFSFFLINGAIPSVLGPPGSSLGYGNGNLTTGLGIQNGYIGIGFDEFGSFSTLNPRNPNSIGVRGPTSTNNPLLFATGTLSPVLYCESCTSTQARSTINTVNVGFNVYQVSISSAGIMNIYRNNVIEIADLDLNTLTGVSLPSSVYFGFAASTGAQVGIKGVNNFTVAVYDSLYSESGTLTGLTGSNTVTLQNNGEDTLILSSNGSFIFPTSLLNGNTYNVTVLTQPATETCTVMNGSGTIAGSNITNITINCS